MPYVRVSPNNQNFNFLRAPQPVPVQPTRVSYYPAGIRWADIFNAAADQYLRENWQDIAKFVIEKVIKPTPRPRHRHRRSRRTCCR
jgi:hypothetical protein